MLSAGNKTRCFTSIKLFFLFEQRGGRNSMKKVTPLVLLGAGLCFASPTYGQQADLSSPDLVLINGKILTMDDRSSVVEAVAILDGKILATGSSASIKTAIGTRTRVLDLVGKTV